MRKTIAVLIGAVGVVLITPGPAVAHVHGFTPLRCVPANANAGAAHAFEVSPRFEGLGGLVPISVGNASLPLGRDTAFPQCP